MIEMKKAYWIDGPAYKDGYEQGRIATLEEFQKAISPPYMFNYRDGIRFHKHFHYHADVDDLYDWIERRKQQLKEAKGE